MAKRSQGIGPRHTKILVFMERYQKHVGYPPSNSRDLRRNEYLLHLCGELLS